MELRCDICNAVITADNIGFVSNPLEGDRIVRCNKCHKIEKKRKNSSYILLD